MHALDQLLYLAFNLPHGAPGWLVEAALWASLELPEWVIAATLALALAGRADLRAHAWRALAAMALAACAASLLKRGLALPRPAALGLGVQWQAHRLTDSFPSAHAAALFAWALTAVAAPLPRAARAAMLAAALATAWSRVALGLHFPSDVLAGGCVGLLAALAVRAAALSLRRRQPARVTAR